MLAALKAIPLKYIMAALAAIVISVLLVGVVAYAGYSWRDSSVQTEKKELADALNAQFERERKLWLDAMNVASTAEAKRQEDLAAIRKSGAATAAEMARIRQVHSTFYNSLIPTEGIKQWESSRKRYNDAARPSSPSR